MRKAPLRCQPAFPTALHQGGHVLDPGEMMLGRRTGQWWQHFGSPSTMSLMGNKLAQKIMQGVCSHKLRAQLSPPKYPCSLLASRLNPNTPEIHGTERTEAEGSAVGGILLGAQAAGLSCARRKLPEPRCGRS